MFCFFAGCVFCLSYNVRVQRVKCITIMATCELRGTLKGRDGQSSLFTVKVENNLKSMITGVQKLNTEISGVLTELVLKERGNEKGDVQPNGKSCTKFTSNISWLITLAM